MGPGENAGAVDVGDGLAVAFKVESHNHPSAVEPFQGAATGVGGILRDVFAVGARPIAVLDSLRFGELAESERSRYLLDHAVAGIGHYGNSIGVPTVGGEIYFEAPYEQNCLVNAMCAGPGAARAADPRRRGRAGQRARAARRAHRPRRHRRRVGAGQRRARRGRRGQAPDRADRRPVRGEEAARVLPRAARPRACSSRCRTSAPRASPPPSSEMATKGEVGLDIDVSPRAAARARHGAVRDHGLRVAGADALRGRARAPRSGARRLRAAGRCGARAIGESPTAAACACSTATTPSATCRCAALVDDCPLYDLEPEPPEQPLYPAARRGARRRRARGRGPARAAAARRTSPRAARCSSSTTRSCSRARCAAPRRPTPRCWRCPAAAAIAVSIDGNGRRVACDPRRGAVEAVLECAANLACVGAEPLGLTNCLNFGNPEKPHIAWQLTEAVTRPGDACARSACRSSAATCRSTTRAPTARSTRRRSSAWSAGCPTPRGPAGSASPQEGDAIALVGPFEPSLAGVRAGQAARRAAARRAAADRPRRGRAGPPRRSATRCAAGALRSAHDIAEGGLARRARRVLPRGRDRRARVDLGPRRTTATAVRRGPRPGSSSPAPAASALAERAAR